ncbi:lipid-A-disaccharide synthase [Thiohalocapsa marina]|uniref:Lipid-A-disaccharide synthase n=1 Tax=Thiohalocapsa marina TaxID=424902 RepID=A0A5M8FIP3_9GAMM|nr:lipid-A-disaccharide synthase [Thiohalocapsa marina]KAA6184808.1 lipid-A-disaccharide synthase [Thiohalocapsa marina]
MTRVIGIVANEPSGDLLGAALVRALRQRLPDARFVGVAGERMQAEGCETLFPLERLSVMGLVEVLKVAPELLRLRRELVRWFRANPPDVFIGVDAPDFNLGLETRLRRAGIRTVHLVSPTVWAWRPGRVKRIRRAVDLMLSIFPFEEAFLRRQGVPVCYVGHPLADEIPFEVDAAAARAALGLPVTDEPATGGVVALLPGSRMSEVERLARPMLETALACARQRPGLRFVVPLVNERLHRVFDQVRRDLAPDLDCLLLRGRSREAIAAADCVLTASGTATLETLLLKRPMLVAYRLNALTYWLVRQLKLIKVPYAAMANLLAGQELAPEFIQERCRAELMAPALLGLLDDHARREQIVREYARIHRELRHQAADRAADAVIGLLQRP